MDTELCGTLRILRWGVHCSVLEFMELDLSNLQKYFMLYVMFYVIVSYGVRSNGRIQVCPK